LELGELVCSPVELLSASEIRLLLASQRNLVDLFRPLLVIEESLPVSVFFKELGFVGFD
jgi:hypothetical protein